MVVPSVTGSEEKHRKIRYESLMDKYKIPVTHFEYSYIETCADGRELEKIVLILRSGEEGFFPDLTRFAEDRLGVVKPRSKVLRKVCPVVSKEALSREERYQLANDLTQWVTNVSQDDKELTFSRNRSASQTSLPEIRELREKVIDEEKKLTKRISSTDYSSWDKYDPDTEILKMELEEENLKKHATKKKSTTKKTVQFKELTTEAEEFRVATYEKEKGNEFFKAGDYEEALKHYTNSINCKPTLPSYTNRALAFIKLKKYKNAIDDCHSALAIEPGNTKALMRKAQALEGLGRHSDALKAVEQTIENDPNNSLAQELAEKLRKLCGMVPKHATRFIVQEIDSGNRKQVIIPLPGTSTMAPPHYITCSDDNIEKVKEETIKANTPRQIVHMVSIDNSDGEDEDTCTVNHLQKICNRHETDSNTLIQLQTTGQETNLKSEKTKTKKQKSRDKKIMPQQVAAEDRRAGGDACVRDNALSEIPRDIHSPYSFLRTWNSANCDKSLEQHAMILRSLDMNRIINVIGCKLDNAMFSIIVKCLSIHFTVPGEVERLYFILENIVNLPRFDIISMLTSPEDRNYVNILVNFLNQHGKPVPQNVFNKLFNNYLIPYIT